MALKTTCIGSYPKPDYVPLTDWFTAKGGMGAGGGEVTRQVNALLAERGEELEDIYRRAAGEVIADQIDCGVDVPTDGEVRRENYIHYHCRHLEGFDFENLTKKSARNDAYEVELPTIRSKIVPKGEHFLDHDFKVAQSLSSNPIKVTIPGPLTVSDTTADAFYNDNRQLAFDLADALNYEIRALAEAGCKYIQLDEPLFARKVERALDYGVECLDRCFDGVPEDVTRVMHMCCGYPRHLDDVDYPKADQRSYHQLAKAVDASTVHQISIEDAHRYNDLGLLELFQSSTIVFGAVAVSVSRVETAEEIAARLSDVLTHIDRDRLWVAPDCGLAMLNRDQAMAKLRALSEAAGSV